MLTAVQIQDTAPSRATRHMLRLLITVLLFIAFTVIANAQIIVPGNLSGRERWVRTDVHVNNGTLITVTATGLVNVGPRGSFGPEGTTAFPGDRALSFPTDVSNLYGLVIRLTSSSTNPEDELREDYAYGATRTICSRASI